MRRARVRGASRAVAALARYACRRSASAVSSAAPSAARNAERPTRSFRYAATVRSAAPRSAAIISRKASICPGVFIRVLKAKLENRRSLWEACVGEYLFYGRGGRRRVPKCEEGHPAEQDQHDHDDEPDSNLPHPPQLAPFAYPIHRPSAD